MDSQQPNPLVNLLPWAVLGGLFLYLHKKMRALPVRRNLDAFTDASGKVHPIRGTQGYEEGKTKKGSSSSPEALRATADEMYEQSKTWDRERRDIYRQRDQLTRQLQGRRGVRGYRPSPETNRQLQQLESVNQQIETLTSKIRAYGEKRQELYERASRLEAARRK